MGRDEPGDSEAGDGLGDGQYVGLALLVVSVGVPVSVHHERQVVADRQAALDRERAMQAEAAKQQAAPAMSDDELLSHVDSDIAQAAPDAMEPLASLMSETAAK